MKTLRISFIVILAALATSCRHQIIYTANKDFKSHTWHKDSIAYFDFDIDDTLGVYSIFINNRVSGEYKYANLYLFINTWLPDNKHLVDTLECFLADPSGKWLGRGFGDVWSNSVYFRRNITFPIKGQYRMSLQQAMREDELQYILDAGISIEKAKIKR